METLLSVVSSNRSFPDCVSAPSNLPNDLEVPPPLVSQRLTPRSIKLTVDEEDKSPPFSRVVGTGNVSFGGKGEFLVVKG